MCPLFRGGTSGGFKIGVGGSNGIASGDSEQQTSTVTSLDAGRDVNLRASNDLNLIGTQVKAQRDIDLRAANNLNIRAAQNDSARETEKGTDLFCEAQRVRLIAFLGL
ncbi:hemagglutinin repeat-containing protein [Pseudomonas ogarae]|nr:hemagglutinin repeat-containing protein [Pseudomonas zarinae]